MAGTFIGIDGCAAGWLIATAGASHRTPHFTTVTDLRPLFASLAATDAQVAIDIPIGLPDAGPRQADLAARTILGMPRCSSVFPVPARATLDAATYEEACAINRRARGKAVPRQLYAMLPRIGSIDVLVSPALQDRIHGCHPEVAYAILSGKGRGLTHPKKTPDGEAERATLGPGVGRVNILDALACLITAQRIATGSATTLPRGRPQLDSHGLRMEMLA